MASRERITGLSIDDILKMPMSKLEQYTPKQQREIISKVASAANKRLKRLEDKGVTTQATLKLKTSGGKISIKGKTGDELQAEFFRARNFLKSKSSTVKGWKETKRRILEGLEKKHIKIQKGMKKDETVSNAFAVYDALSEYDNTLITSLDRYALTERIAEIIEDEPDFDIVFKRAQEEIERMYLENQREFDKYNISDYDIPEDNTPTRLKRR